MYDIKAKATHYSSVNFRSRLEAKWAAYFDMVDWEWQYEPLDINGKVPDFIIKCNSPMYEIKQLIIEVKPEVYCTDEFYASLIKSYKEYPAHLLILTENPVLITDYHVGPGKGYQYHKDVTGEDPEIYLLDWKGPEDIGSSYMAYDGMIHGTIERKYFTDNSKDGIYGYRIIEDLFKEAGNRVQFKSY